MGTGAMFNNFPGLVEEMKKQNIKGISITIPGHAYSSTQPVRKIGDWPKHDVAPVLMAEGVTGEFMVQGASFGAAHAMAVAHYFGPAISGVNIGVSVLHGIVPYIPIPLREELGFAKYLP